MTAEIALETRSLTKRFGDFTAVDQIDLLVPRGSFYGFLGPNGAGKSTTINCLTGLLRPTTGRMRILGRDPIAEPVAVKREIGVVPEDLALFDYLTAGETLGFVGRAHELDSATVQERTDELLDLMGLAEDAGGHVGDFSHGMKKKLALAVALLPAPRLLFLDEPFEGIDAVSSRLVRQILEAFVRRGGTIFLTSHILEIVDQVCDHIGILHQGRLVAQGPIADLRAGGTSQSLEDLFLRLVGGQDRTADLPWLMPESVTGDR